MNKEEFIKMLEEGIKIEENLIPLYSKHITNTLFLSGFTGEKQTRIKRVLTILKNESEIHRRIYHKLLENARKEEKDVY